MEVKPLLLSGDLGYLLEKSFSKLQIELGDVERMLKALVKSLEIKPLIP
jgi:hypothetical protein